MILSPVRRTAAAASVLTLSLALTACGSDDTDTQTPESSPSATPGPTDEAGETGETGGGPVLSEDELTSALLTAEDLPGGYVIDPDDEEEDSTAFEGSCLEVIGDLASCLLADHLHLRQEPAIRSMQLGEEISTVYPTFAIQEF